MSHPSLLVGCGRRAQTHARALAESDRFDLVAVCDLVAEKAASTADEFGVPETYTDVDEAIERADPVHVSAITMPSARLPLVPDVLSHAPDSLVIEKPVAHTLDEVLEIADAADAVDTDVAVCHQTPFSDELRALKEWVDDGRIGDVTRAVATTKLGVAAQGTHFVHSLNWLLDAEPERVRGWATGHEGLDPDTGSGHAEPGDAVYELAYPDDTRAFFHQGEGAPDVPGQPGAPLEYRLDLVGADGRGAFVLGSHAELVTAEGEERVEARSFDEGAYATRALYERLAAVLDGDADGHPADLDSAVSVHRAIDAAMRSTVEGRPVAPSADPPALGTTTNDRLAAHLAARRPVTVSSLLYADRDRAAVLDSLADLGVSQVDLWATGAFVDYHADPATESADEVAADLAAHDLSAPVVSVYDDDPVPEKLRFAADLGADTVVMGGRTPERPDGWDPDRLREYLDVAADAGLTLAFENHVDAMETVDEMTATLDALDHPAAGICLAPSHLWLAGERADAAVAALGDAVEVLYLWDIEPGATRDTADDLWYGRADSQVPGGGGAVDFERYLAAAVEHAPDAHWVLCYHGTEEWDRERVDQSVARGLRYVDDRRPT